MEPSQNEGDIFEEIPVAKGEMSVDGIAETLALLRRYLAQEYSGDSIVDVAVLQCQMLLHLYKKLEDIEAKVIASSQEDEEEPQYKLEQLPPSEPPSAYIEFQQDGKRYRGTVYVFEDGE